MEGFEKIEFSEKKRKSIPENDASAAEKSTKPVNLTGKPSLMDKKGENFTMAKRKQTSRSKFRFRWSRKGFSILAIVLVLFVLAGIPAFATYKSGLKTYREAKL